MFCGACGAAFAPDAKFCGSCGAPRSGMVSRPPLGSPAPSPAPASLPASPLTSLPVAPPTSMPVAQVSPDRRSPLLAAFLECLVPGIGLMYAGGGCSGAFALVSSFAAGVLLFLNGLGMAPHTRPAGMARYIFFAVTLLFIWLVVRAVWAGLLAQRHNERLLAPAPSVPLSMPAGPYFGGPGPR